MECTHSNSLLSFSVSSIKYVISRSVSSDWLSPTHYEWNGHAYLFIDLFIETWSHYISLAGLELREFLWVLPFSVFLGLKEYAPHPAIFYYWIPGTPSFTV